MSPRAWLEAWTCIGGALVGLFAKGQPFADVTLGKSASQPTDVRLVLPSEGHDLQLTGVSFGDESFRLPVYYGARLGYEGSGGVAVAVELVHLKLVADTAQLRRMRGTVQRLPIDELGPLARRVSSLSVTHGTNHVALEVLVRRGVLGRDHRFPGGRLEVHAGLGLSGVVAHPEVNFLEHRTGDRWELAGPGALLFAGLRLWAWPQLGVLAEYKASASHLSFGLGEGGRGSLFEKSHHFTLGLCLRLPASEATAPALSSPRPGAKPFAVGVPRARR